MIILWISKHSLAGAKTWMDRWDELLTQLEESADPCPFAPENDDHQETIRHQIFKMRRGKKYRVIFVIRSERVFITNVRGPGQDILKADEIGWI